MSATSRPAHDELREISVIPVTDSRNDAGRFEHRLPPVSQTTRPQSYLEKNGDVHLPAEAIRRLVQGAVEPDTLDGIRIERHRVETGWLMVTSYRAYAPMISLAIENDRLLAEALYAADPRATGNRVALTMPQPHDKYAVLVHTDDHEDVLESVDRAHKRVVVDNPQDVGARLVERPLMLVPATFKGDDGRFTDDYTAVDGNCRLASCLSRIQVTRGWLDGSLPRDEATKRVPLLPSHLMRLTLDDRRKLLRNVIKAEHKRLSEPGTGTDDDIADRNQAAMALNALTVPVQVIVGYSDDEPARGMQRFPAAVRALLMRMNVGVKQFEPGARHAVTAEEIVIGLHDNGLLGSETEAGDMRDILIGRGRVADAMEELGLDARLPDLRFALIMQQLTRKEPQFNALVRSKLDKPGNLVLSRRNAPVVELGLRSYSASAEMTSVRKSLETGCLWQDLIDNPWTVENIDTDAEVDDLLARALTGEVQATLLLGALGMVGLVMSGHLLAAAGSAEGITNTTIARTSVGQIIKGLLDENGGPQLLADTIKRTRAGLEPRWWDGEKEELVEKPHDSKGSTWKGSTYNAHLRSAVRHGFKVKTREETSTETQGDALTRVQEALVESGHRLGDLIDLREKNAITDRLPWLDVEAAFTLIMDLEEDLRGISEPKPRTR